MSLASHTHTTKRWNTHTLQNRTDNQSSLDKNTRVMVQCKNYKKKIGPVHVREIEGALGGRAQKTVGLLVTPKGFSPMCISRSDSSAYPLALIVVSEIHDIVSIHTNASLRTLLPTITIGTKHEVIDHTRVRIPVILHRSRENGMVTIKGKYLPQRCDG